MRRKTAGLVIGLGLLALPATSLGGGGATESAVPERRAELGRVIGKDSAKKRPTYAVARVTLTREQIGRVFYRVTTTPKKIPVEWGITTRCVKGSLIDYFPGPGDFKTTQKPSGFKGSYRVPLADPDFCTFAVAATIHKNDLGKRVQVKIFSK